MALGTCTQCGGTGQTGDPAVTCDQCRGTGQFDPDWRGYLIELNKATKEKTDDMSDKIDDVIDKLNDIWEKLNEA